MLVALALPRIIDPSAAAIVRITAVHAVEGSLLPIGAKLLDLSVDLSAAAPRDCPSVSNYRIAMSERLWLRRLYATAGIGAGGRGAVEAGAALALFSTQPDTRLDGPVGRAARVSLAGIIAEPDWWSSPGSSGGSVGGRGAA